MRKWFRVAIFILTATGLAGLCRLTLCPHDPTYQGKSVQQYLDKMATYFPRGGDGSDVKTVYAMGPEAIPYLRRALHRQKSIGVRSLVFLQTRLPTKLGDRLPTPPAPEYLTDIATAAANCLAAFGPTARAAVPDLLDCFDDPGSISSAFGAILQIGARPEDLPRLLMLSQSTNWGAPTYAMSLIGTLGVASPEVLDTLTNLAANGHFDVRQAAMQSLGELGPRAAPAIPVLSRNLGDQDSSVRILSAATLWQIQGKTNASLPLLIKEFGDELDHGSAPSNVENVFGQHEENLMICMEILKQMGGQAHPAVPLLHKVQSEKPIPLRLMAADALWRISGETNDVERTCIEGLAYSDSSDQIYAADLMSKFCIEQHRALPILNEMMRHRYEVVQFYAARALWELNGETEETIPRLIFGLHNHDYYYQKQQVSKLALDTLGEMGPKARSAFPALLVALKEGPPEVRAAAAKALKQIDPEAAAKAGVR